MPIKKEKNKDECIQLKNINYQSMLLKRNSNIDSQRGGTENIDKYLEQEQNKKKNIKPWSKLEKSTKLKKIYNYIENLYDKFKMTELEKKELKKYMRTCLERKKLQRIKDVIYEIKTGEIKDIPGLSFNEKNRKFILRKIDKKGSTLRNLAPKNSTRGKTKKKSDRKKKKSDRRRSPDRKKSEKKNRKIKNKTNKIDKHLKD